MKKTLNEVTKSLIEGVSSVEIAEMEEEKKTLTFDQELDYYQLVKNGEVEILMDKFGDYKEDGKGILSKDSIRNTRYHLIILTSLFARYCIEGGLEHMEAYHMSDYYINRLDCCNTQQELKDMYQEILFGYASTMKNLKQQKRFSKPVIQSKDYIGNHLHENFRVQEIADNVNLNPKYLEVLFKKETGCTIAEYVRIKRIDVAKRMLLYSEYSFADITDCLAFHSHSHFISVFKRYVGMTPLDYRKQYFRMMPKVDDPYASLLLKPEKSSASPEQMHVLQQEGKESE